MKKTLTINLNGIVFHIDEDAYQLLARYLDDVRAHLAQSDDKDEILSDVEARIGELFTECTQEQKREVVSEEMVRSVMDTLGSPSDYGEGTGGDSVSDAAKEKSPKQPRRFYRDVDNALLGGVFSGLAAMLGWDVLWLRLAFIVLVVVGYGWPVLLYLVMWLIAPPARTVAQKLEMRGRPVTVENIKERIEGQMAEGAPGNWMLRILRGIFKVIAGFFIVVFGFVAVVILFALMAAFAGLLFGFTTAAFSINDIIGWPFCGGLLPWQNTMLTVSAILLVACPVIVLVAGIVSLLSKRKWTAGRFNLSFLVVWLLALGGAAVTLATTPVARAAIYDFFHADRRDMALVNSFRPDAAYEMMDYPPFTAVELEGMVNLTLTGDTASQVAMRYHTSQLEAYVKDNTLHIDNDAPMAVDVELSNPRLERLVSGGVCNIACSDTLRLARFDLRLDDVSKVMLLYVGDELGIRCEDASKVTVAGRAGRAVFRLADTGKLDAFALVAGDVELHSSGVGRADVHAVRTLSVDADDLSKITVEGNPKLLQKTPGSYPND